MLRGNDQKEIAEAILRLDNADENTILPGGKGSNRYEVILTKQGITIEKPIIVIRFKAVTDQIAVNVVKRQAKGLFKNDELHKLSGQFYTFKLFF